MRKYQEAMIDQKKCIFIFQSGISRLEVSPKPAVYVRMVLPRDLQYIFFELVLMKKYKGKLHLQHVLNKLTPPRFKETDKEGEEQSKVSVEQ
jgi:hypothetical protein